MNTDNTYFDYIAILRLNDNELNFDTLIYYANGTNISEEELIRARAKVLRIASVGLVSMSSEEDWQNQKVTLTGFGEIAADVIAYMRSGYMIQQSNALLLG